MRLERANGVTLLRMEAGKANAIGAGFLDALERRLDDLERDGARALVVTGYERFFSAGLDLPGLLPLDRPTMERFMGVFRRVMLRLFELPLPVVAAVNGHAIAGGCVLALQADARLMAAGDVRIGLKEAQLGIGLPPVVVETMRCQVPPAALVPAALEGRLFTPGEAVRLGLVDEVVPAEALLPRALERAGELASVPPAAYAQIKAALRGPVADRVREAGELDDRWLTSWFSEEGRGRVSEAVRRLADRARG